jgi:hypothetical protein
MKITEDFVAKRASDSIRRTTAKRVGRTSGRTAKGLAKVIAVRKTSEPGLRRKKAPMKAAKEAPAEAPKADAVVAARQAQTKARESWKAQEQHAADAVKSQHGTMVDERALARATDGQRWAARKPR